MKPCWVRVSAAILGGLVMSATAADAPASSRSAPAPATVASVATPPTSTTTNHQSGDAGTGNSSQPQAGLASWIDMLAAQTAATAIAKQAPMGQKVVVVMMPWSDYVQTIHEGRVIDDRISQVNTLLNAEPALENVIRKTSSDGCGGTTPPPPKPAIPLSDVRAKGLSQSDKEKLLSASVGANRSTFFTMIAAAGGSTGTGASQAGVSPSTAQPMHGWLANDFNPWLAAIETMTGSMQSISNNLRPKVDAPAPGAAGLVTDDLFPTPLSASSSSVAQVYVPPFISQPTGNSAIDTASNVRIVSTNLAIAAAGKDDSDACKALKSQVTEATKALGALADSLQPDGKDGVDIADQALALYDLAKPGTPATPKRPLYVVDIHLTREFATDRAYSNLWPTAKRLMQGEVLARYRIHDGSTGQILRAGTLAVVCQALTREGLDGKGAFGGDAPSSDRLCEIMASPPSSAGKMSQ